MKIYLYCSHFSKQLSVTEFDNVTEFNKHVFFLFGIRWAAYDYVIQNFELDHKKSKIMKNLLVRLFNQY